MSETTVFFNRTVEFFGRNGRFHNTAVKARHRPWNNTIVFTPITSFKKEGKCEIEIPVEDFEDFIRQLYDVFPEGVQEYFPITSVCRGDIVCQLKNPGAYEIPANEMRRLASKMADGYCEDLWGIQLDILPEQYCTISKPDAIFVYCTNCRQIQVIPDIDAITCPLCEQDTLVYVREIASELDLADEDNEFDNEFSELVHSKYFNLEEWVKDHSEFMQKNTLFYTPSEVKT